VTKVTSYNGPLRLNIGHVLRQLVLIYIGATGRSPQWYLAVAQCVPLSRWLLDTVLLAERESSFGSVHDNRVALLEKPTQETLG